MTDQFPNYVNFDIGNYNSTDEALIFSLIKSHRHDIEIVAPAAWQDYDNYGWLDSLIGRHLENNKKILLFPNEERFIFPPNDQAKMVLNRYQHESVWLVTQLSEKSQLLYRFQHQLSVKFLELPYVMLELCETYYQLKKKSMQILSHTDSNYNFLSMCGRYQEHKADLIQAIYDHQLDQFGLITVLSDNQYPEWIKKICKSNTMPTLPRVSDNYNTRKHLIDRNVVNFLHIEQMYSCIPLILHAETNWGIFYCTEKSFWPLLLGKLYLGFGPPGNMQYIQKFYDVQIDDYANLDYDQPVKEWTAEGNRDRMKIMLEKNQQLIKSAKEVYADLQPQLETARWTLGKNLYNFCINQLLSTS